jgi:hypothetical protein
MRVDMKKVICLLLIIIIVCSLGACAQEPETIEVEPEVIKFKEFEPYYEVLEYEEYIDYTGLPAKRPRKIIEYNTIEALNKWLEENPNVEIIDWYPIHPTATAKEYHIIVQYKEN